MSDVAMRFVVLRHETREETHWDLMLDRGLGAPGLATWRLVAPPHADAAESIAAVRIGDHRRAYLDYEGSLSGDRGTVARYDAGIYRVIHATDQAWELDFDGRRLKGRYGLSVNGLGGPSDWLLRRL